MFKQQLLVPIVFFIALGCSHWFFEPAYNGYLIAYIAVLAGLLLRQKRIVIGRHRMNSSVKIALSFCIVLTIFVTLIKQPHWWDVLRDLGVPVSFFFGRYVLPSWSKKSRMLWLLRALSYVSIFVAIATLMGAAAAYAAGASEYIWRGVYVPYMSSWLPYFLVINVALVWLDPERSIRYVVLSCLCVAAALASLARTSFLMDGVFLLILLCTHGRTMIFSTRGVLFLIVLGVAGYMALPRFLSLNVVQHRIAATQSTNDASLDWRYTENKALLDYMNRDDGINIPFGFGWGARVPLPVGVKDFNGRNSIPFLHNSILTIILKFGILGFIIFGLFVCAKMRSWWRMRHSHDKAMAFAGGWLMLFVLGSAMTLQGLTEWSHVIFFGISCALLSPGMLVSDASSNDEASERTNLAGAPL